ncbi:MAG: transporter [Nitrospirae bacterium GWC2_42_7]|nr:MAG: transporter [Nitrospirae bacterium GWC2_42_7]
MLKDRTNTLYIRTPEGIIFSMLLAGPVTRFLAWGIDLACISVASSIIGTALIIFSIVSLDLAQALTALSFFIISIGYGIAAEWYWRGQTIGKKLLKLRVMDVQGLRLHFSQIMIRNLLRFVDSLPIFYFVGGVACLMSSRSQRLGDIAANTIVVRNPKIAEPDLKQILAGKYNSLRDYPYLSARLRQKVTPQEASIALQALLRRDELEPQARIELFEQIAAHFRTIVEFPEEAVQGITDEQYIRNVVDVVFKSH